MNSVEVRKATPVDAGHVADCHDRCFKKTFSAQLLAGDLEPPETLLAASSQPTFKLHTRVENLNAIGFYEHAGWTVTDHTIRTVEHGLSYEERVLIKHRQVVP